MRVSRSADTPEAPFDADTFSGPVTRRDHGAIGMPAGTALVVRFPPGARTHWHSHPGGQLLYVTEGRGRVGTRDGRIEEIGPGDVVIVPPDEEHWHGAVAAEGVAHLALSFGATAWSEPVDG